jgi:hypothetical protein
LAVAVGTAAEMGRMDESGPQPPTGGRDQRDTADGSAAPVAGGWQSAAEITAGGRGARTLVLVGLVIIVILVAIAFFIVLPLFFVNPVIGDAR